MSQRCRQLTAFLTLACLIWLMVPPGVILAGVHEAVDYEDMTFVPFDWPGFVQRAETVQKISQEAVNSQAVLIAFGGLERLQRECSSSAALAQIAYRRDMNDSYWAQAMQTEQENVQRVNAKLLETAQMLLASPCAPVLKEAWGEALCDRIMKQKPLGAEEQILLSREQSLLAQYDQAYQTAFWVRYQDQLITENNPWLVELAPEALEEYRQLAFDQGSAILGPIYQELVSVRNELARLRGYSDYTAYAYVQTYGRDYTAAESQVLHEQVAAYLVPLQEMLVETWQAGQSQLVPEVDVSTEGLLGLLSEQFGDLSPELGEAFGYMLSHHLYDYGTEDERFTVSYTTFLPQYGAPFTQIKQTGRLYDLFNLIHEFGHFNNYYHNAADYCQWLPPVCYDLAEAHSQGLEMLMAARYQSIWGKQAGRALALYHLINGLDVVIQGALEDEFQQAVYARPEMSVAEMNHLYSQLKSKYHVLSVGESDGSWVLVPNTYHAPLYYISYSVSMLAALELWSIAQRDEDAAWKKYGYLVESGERLGYQEALANCGLTNPFRADAVKSVAQAVGSSWGYSKGRTIRFLDVSGHWAESDIYQAVAQGLFAGTEPMIYEPETALTRASAVVLLSRLLGANLYRYHDQQVFDDVEADRWYGPAVAWAVEQGLVHGVGEGRFAPDAPVSREQLAAMLSPLLQTQEPIRPLNFADEDAVSPWAQASVQQAVALGLMNGRDETHFAPQVFVTRAEAAVIFVRLLKLSHLPLQPAA